jgi:hypothetical protein
MAERRAQPHPTIENGYHIPIDTERLTNFPHQGQVAVVLTTAHESLEVYQKDIPSHLIGKNHKGKPVKWLNNFGLKKVGSEEYVVSVPEYRILLDHIKNAVYVYFDGSEIRPLQTSQHETDLSKVQASLFLGDPPVGWTG